VELRRFRAAVEAAGYTGPIEVEVFNEAVWARPGREVLDEALDGYQRHVL
jgi:sugar phosphate isomerase/epimerase